MKRAVSVGVVISLALFLSLTILFWVRSFRSGDKLARYHNSNYVLALSYKGVIAVSWGTNARAQPAPLPEWEITFWPFGETQPINLRSSDFWERSFLGFYSRFYSRIGHGENDVQVPYWFLAGVMLVPLLLIWRSRFDSLRALRCERQKLCRNCGYDLRATPDRCPECGTIPAAGQVKQGLD